MSGFYTNEQGKAIKFAEGNVSLQASMPVGSIFPSAIPIVDRRVHLLDGTTISQEGTYENFAILINALISAGHNITCTQEEFDTSVSTYGQCGKFVVDNDAKTIRLPLITEFIASNNGGKEIGLAQLDEFKSHSHPILMAYNQTANNSNGALMGYPNYEWRTYSGQSVGGEETRPKNIRYPYYIVLASGFKTNADIIIDPFIDDVEKIKSEYIKSATIADDVLKITDQNNNTIEFQGGGGGGLITLTEDTHLIDLQPNIYSIETGSGLLANPIKFYYNGSTENSYVNIRNGFINVMESYDSYSMRSTKQFFGDVYIEGSVKDGVYDSRSTHVFILGWGRDDAGYCAITYFNGNEVIATRQYVDNNMTKITWKEWS